MRASNFAAILIVNCACLAQSSNTGGNQIANNASCSNTKIDAKGNVTFTCSGLTATQTKLLQDIPGLLNTLLRTQQRDTTEILKRLNGCVTGVEQVSEGYWPKSLPAQFDRPISELQAFAGTRIELAVENPDDHNRGAFAVALQSFLNLSGWEATVTYPMVLPGPNSKLPHGLLLQAKQDSPAIQALAKVLIGAFGKENVSGQLVRGFIDPTTTIAIQIWPKVSK